MKEMKIKLFTIQEVREFVNNVILVDFEVDLVQGRYIIDAKSIMGIFSLDLLSPITVVAHTDSPEAFFGKISKFKAD
ncbi:MAG: HPr family phosphocarrier protein [Clostridia bacterium]|nr:HPr family phosphocarrier protein [Clostridia bacterium]